jgi:hypothetical protein
MQGNNKKLNYHNNMKLLDQIISLFVTKQKPVYGIRIFQQQSWLDKQVQESQWKRRFLVD